MSYARFFMLVLGFVLLMMAGCSDDNATNPVQPTVPLGHARGSITLRPQAVLDYFKVFGNGTRSPNLDSVRIGDSLIASRFIHMEGPGNYVDAYSVISWAENGSASTYMYDHGDTATITFWAEDRSSSCRLKLLNPESASVYITAPLRFADTIEQGQSDTIYWNRVPEADYYAVMVPWLPIAGDWKFLFDYTLDTSYVLSGASMPDSVQQADVVVTPFTGPDPRTGLTNWSGTLLDGAVFSYGSNDYTSIVISSPPPAPGRLRPNLSAARPEQTPSEIVAKVYERFGH